MSKTFTELCDMKVADLRQQCDEKGKHKNGTKIELVKRLLPETETYVFLDKKVSELRQVCKTRGLRGYSKQKWAELIVRLQPNSQMKTQKPILPTELVMFIRKQATDLSKEELRLKKRKQVFKKIRVYINQSKCRPFYMVHMATFRLLSIKQKTTIHRILEKEVLYGKLEIDNVLKLIKSKLTEFGFTV